MILHCSAVKELKNQYLNKGYYSIVIEHSIEELDRIEFRLIHSRG